MSKRYTIEEIRQMVSTMSDCELLSTEYKGVYAPLRFRCACGREFEKAWNHFRYDRYRGCQICARASVGERRRLTDEQVAEAVRERGCEYLGGYSGRKKPFGIRFRCGHTGTITLNSVLGDQFCGECPSCVYDRVHGANRLLRDEVADKCRALGAELLSERYVNAKTPITLRCACGAVFTTTWNVVKSTGKTRCDRCTGLQSAGAKKVEEYLIAHGVPFTKEKTFSGCVSAAGKRLRFDYFLPSLNVCVEFDGRQHYEPMRFGSRQTGEDAERALERLQENDRTKDLWCAEHGIQLIRIDYWDQKNISSILDSMLIPR